MSDTMHWARWGDPAREMQLAGPTRALIDAAFGARSATPPVQESQIPIAACGLMPDALSALTEVVGQAYVDISAATRLRHTGGKSTSDLLRRRRGDAANAPDAVVRPATHEQVQTLLAICAAHHLVVVPFGGGTSVVGGLDGSAGGERGWVALDLGRLDRLLDIDLISMTATLQAGVTGPDAERLLGKQGLTLGHFPQSFEYASIGGFAATRSSGQASSGYGRFDEMVVGMTVATPRGTWRLGSAPMTAAGPDLRQMLLGSEGAFGVITSVRLAVHLAPQVQEYQTWRLASFQDGANALRALVQEGLNPTVLRLSDEMETAVNLASPVDIGTEQGGISGGVSMVCGYEGTRVRVDRMRREVEDRLRELGAVPQDNQSNESSKDGASWAAGRFDGPYLRDALLDEGLLVETLETAGFWSDLPAVYSAVSGAVVQALSDGTTSPIVMCHISHLYRTGASLYFTVVCPQDADPVAQWARAKVAANDAIRGCGATITHHHGVGVDHRPWLATEIGELGVDVLRAVKECLDPQGVLNPGVLIP
ncbi:FAD-binding oxidoreductase [Dermatophilaceae bacterium Sec6.4]